MTEVKRAADGWLEQSAYKGLVVYDPDGWDRRGGYFDASWAEEITEEEFKKRLSVSTCLWHSACIPVISE